MLSVISIIAASSFCGCAKPNSNKGEVPNVSQQEKQPHPMDLSGKPVAEVFAIKYDKAELSCALWVQRSYELNLTSEPNDAFVLDLKSDAKLPQTFKLSAQLQNHTIKAHVEVSSLAIWDVLQFQDAQGNVYHARHSPYVNYVFRYQSQTFYEHGVVFKGDGSHSNEARENIVNTPFNGAHDSKPLDQNGMVADLGPYRTYFQCVLNTVIKPEYQNQFRIQRRNR